MVKLPSSQKTLLRDWSTAGKNHQAGGTGNSAMVASASVST